MKRIKMTEFGRDHWSLLAYLETCCVEQARGDGLAVFDKRRVRCHPKRHAIHNVNANMGDANLRWERNDATRLFGYKSDRETPRLRLRDHDDYDCLDDLEAAELVEVHSLANGAIKMLPRGLRLAHMLRQHKTQGGSFATFVLADKIGGSTL
jgi:hypothetical protein